GIDPGITTASARKHQAVRLVSFDHCETHVAVHRNVGRSSHDVPHDDMPPWKAGKRIDLSQSGASVRMPTLETMETAMDRFIRRENVKHFRELLKTTTSQEERQRILKLLAEAEQKQKDAGDRMDEGPCGEASENLRPADHRNPKESLLRRQR